MERTKLIDQLFKLKKLTLTLTLALACCLALTSDLTLYLFLTLTLASTFVLSADSRKDDPWVSMAERVRKWDEMVSNNDK